MRTRNSFLPTDLWVKFGGLLLAGLMLLSMVIACRSSSDKGCTGEVTYEGKTYTGEGKDAEEAQRFACNKYCLEADPEFDARYRVWLDSPKGKAADSPPKTESIYKDKDLLDYVTKTCAPKCVASIKDGKLKGATKCP